MVSATILTHPNTGLNGILYCSKRYKMIGRVIVTFNDIKE